MNEVDCLRAIVLAPKTGGGGTTPSLSSVLAVGHDAGGISITGLADPANPQDAATRAYVLANAGGSQTLAQTLAFGNDANALRIVNLADPADAQDAVTRNFWYTNAAPYAASADQEHSTGNPLVYSDFGSAFRSLNGDFILYDPAIPGNALNATNDKNGLEIDTNYLLLNGDGSNVLFGGNLYNSTAFGASLDLSGNGSNAFFMSVGKLISSDAMNAFYFNGTSWAPLFNNDPVSSQDGGTYLDNSGLHGVADALLFNGNIYSSTGFANSLDFSAASSLIATLLAAAGITPIADGTYTVGLGVTTNGTITIAGGLITAIQEAT